MLGQLTPPEFASLDAAVALWRALLYAEGMADSVLRAFDHPNEVREFPLGRFEIVHVAAVTLGRATYQPGWRWSVHNAPAAGTRLCHAPHTGAVLSGHGIVEYEDGTRLDLLPGMAFHVNSTPHDSWVAGDVPYVSLHILRSP